MYYIIGILVLFIIILLSLSKIRRENFDYEMELGAEDISSNIKTLALSLRGCDKVGISPDLRPILRKINTAHRILSSKVKRGEELVDYEKWLNDNYFYVKNKLQNKRYADFALLPHKKKRARVLHIADFIVKTCNFAPNFNHIKKVVQEFNSFTPLQYDEIMALEGAVVFALCGKITNLSQSVIKASFYQRKANKKALNNKFAQSDTYLYFWGQNGNTPTNAQQDILRDVNLSSCEFSYLSGLVRKSDQARGAISAMKKLADVQYVEWLDICPACNLMCEDATFCKMDALSKKQYLYAVNELSYHFKTSEKAIIDAVFALSKQYSEHFGSFLFEHKLRVKAFLANIDLSNVKLKEGKLNAHALLIAVWLLKVVCAGAICLLIGEWAMAIPCFVLLLFALHPLAEKIIFVIFASLISAKPIPRLDYKLIPNDAKTLVVISHYIADIGALEDAIFSAQKMASVNIDKNLSFALLIDYKSCDDINCPTDEVFDKVLRDRLNAKDRVFALVRKRVLRDGKYSGHERKRGAIMALNHALISGDYSDFRYKIFEETKKPKFVCLLDADSEVLPQFFSEAVNTMLHPLNAKYDLLAFKSNYNLSTLNTQYSKKFLYQSGKEEYGNYSSLYFNICNREIFCGKGIYRLENYYAKLRDVLPDGKVLSHDIIEGALLVTGSVSSKIYEEAPQSFLADVARSSRWQQGDIQLLPFIKNRITNNNKSKIVMKKPTIYNYIMITNAFSGIFTFAQFVLLMFSFAFGGLALWLAAAICTLGEPLLLLFSNLNQITKGAKTSHTLKCVFSTVVSAMQKVFLLPFFALRALTLFIVTLYKMSKGKGLLEWKTFRAQQGKNSFAQHLKMILPSVLLLTALSIFFIGDLVWIIYVAISIFLETAIFYFGKNYSKSPIKKISNRQLENLQNYAKKTYQFFVKTQSISNNFLGADNLQILPKKAACGYTSITNIGFSLVAHICALEMGLAQTDEVFGSVTKTLDSVFKLKKFKGNLYNWYNTDTMTVTGGEFVSSVDSANFLVCAIVCKEFLYSIASEVKGAQEYADKLKKLIDGTRLSVFYNEKKQRYAIGIEAGGKQTEGAYDLLASESRLLAFLGVVGGESIFAWNNLGRDCVRARGDVMLSWSGTMFEYLMPQLFLPDVNQSLIDQSCRTATRVQIASKCKGVFGISESGYYKFDNKLNYQYYAFGIRQLALRNQFDRCVISPYSSFLALPYAPKKVVSNLAILESRDLLGSCGFYEAVDYTNGKNAVCSHMSHHQGMILVALCNFLRDNAIKKLFAKDKRVAGGMLLLTERKNIFKSVKKEASDFLYDLEGDSVIGSCVDPVLAFPQVNTLANESYCCVVDDCGCGFGRIKGIGLARFEADIYKDNGVFSYFCENDKSFGPTYAPLRNQTSGLTCYFTKGESKFTNEQKGVEMRVFVPYGFSGEVRRFSVKNDGIANRKLSFAVYCDLMMNYPDSDFSHRAFENLFVETSFDQQKNAIIAKRNARDGGEVVWSAMCWKGIDLRPNSNKSEALGRLNSAKNPDIAKGEIDEKHPFGEVLEPCFAGRGDIEVTPATTKDFYVCFIMAETREKLLEQLTHAQSEDFLPFVEQYNAVKIKNLGDKLLTTKRHFALSNALAARLIYLPYCTTALVATQLQMPVGAIEKLGISVDLKTIYYRFGTKESMFVLRNCCEFLSKAGYSFAVVVDFGEENKPNGIVKKEVEKCFEGVSFVCKFVDRFLVKMNVVEQIRAVAFIELTASLRVDDFGLDTITERSCDANNYQDIKTKQDIILDCGKGGFDKNNDFIVTKRPLLPYSNVVCQKKGGFIATENGGGFSYFENSRENKLTSFSNLPIEDGISEGVFLLEGDCFWRINKGFDGGTTTHSKGKTTYKNSKSGVYSQVEMFIVDDGLSKIYEIKLQNQSDVNRKLSLALAFDLCLGWKTDSSKILVQKLSDCVGQAVNIANGKQCYLKALCGAQIVLDKTKLFKRSTGHFVPNKVQKSYEFAPFLGAICNVELSAGAARTLQFVFSGEKTSVDFIDEHNIVAKKKISLDFFGDLAKFKIKTGLDWLDISINDWTLYQVVSARLFGRCGFYQTGGAIGFRDQLQDCLAMIYCDPKFARQHIISCAAHQFVEGDVQHWWHPEYFGVRTKISDDKLFLPYVTFEYISATGDRTILDEVVPYISGQSVPIEKEAVLYHATPTNGGEQLFEHIKRAIDCSLDFGEHMLPLIGCGDWNDALNDIGTKGRGESVWLGMFLYLVITQFIEYLPCEERLKYVQIADKLKLAVGATFDDGRFARAFTDDGKWLGKEDSSVCKIDILSQSFSVISGITDTKTAQKALSACKGLIDEKFGLIKLLDPSFDKDNNCGYISAYPRGIRENGGQYTHAAMWYVKAVAMTGKKSTALKLLEKLSPLEKCKTQYLADIYKSEPYVLCADIYTNQDCYGRGGWSWYTGSAAWYYKIVFEDILGIKLKRGCIEFTPNLPQEIDCPEISFRTEKSLYKIKYKRADQRALYLGRVEIATGNTLVLPLYDNKDEYEVTVFY